jgi:hypothetical protein
MLILHGCMLRDYEALDVKVSKCSILGPDFDAEGLPSAKLPKTYVAPLHSISTCSCDVPWFCLYCAQATTAPPSASLHIK